jgi:hypothetical protein
LPQHGPRRLRGIIGAADFGHEQRRQAVQPDPLAVLHVPGLRAAISGHSAGKCDGLISPGET